MYAVVRTEKINKLYGAQKCMELACGAFSQEQSFTTEILWSGVVRHSGGAAAMGTMASEGAGKNAIWEKEKKSCFVVVRCASC
jgi:hypothetical protein